MMVSQIMKSDINDHHQGTLQPTTAPTSSRIIGLVNGTHAGPCLICLGSIHGNEPSGALALQRIFKIIDKYNLQSKMNGDFTAIIGNRKALEEKRRFIHHDLNRAWDQNRVTRARQMRNDESKQISDEDWEQFEIIKAIDEVLQKARGTIYFLDLHTTSAASRPFVLIGDTLRNRDFAKFFPVPTILGLEEQIDGSITEWMHSQGAVSIGFESGQHDDPASIDRHEAGIWLALAAAGIINPENIPDYEKYYQLLMDATDDLPPFIEVRYRHGITPENQFRMNPGYENLQRIHIGETLAIDSTGRIKAREAGRILLPLYQGDGADGFFIARDVKPIWLTISRILRHLRIGKLAPILPGVHHYPGKPGTLIVDSKIARWMACEVFHLLGYRKIRQEGNSLTVSRREFDIK